MRIKVSPGTVAIGNLIQGEMVRVEFDKDGEAEVSDAVGRHLVKKLAGVKEIKPTKEVEE
jgi:hypothetical protein